MPGASAGPGEHREHDQRSDDDYDHKSCAHCKSFRSRVSRNPRAKRRIWGYFLGYPRKTAISLLLPGRLFGLELPQLPLKDLAGDVARQLGQEDDLARDLVAGQVRLHVGLQVVLARLLAL